MERVRNASWLKVSVLLPSLVGGALTACGGDSEMSPAGNMSPGGSTAAPGGSGEGTAVLVTADITSDTTWDRPTYLLKQKVFVTNNAKLTIAAGTTILADPGASDKTALVISRGSQLLARGTKDKPIVFTSGAPEGSRKGGDWGGVVLLGSGRINKGAPCASGVAGCKEGGAEGLAPTEAKGKYGGVDDTSSCGELQYVRIEFSGVELSAGNELQGLTVGACGSGTKISYLQVHGSTDDGIELFGGTVGMDHVVLTANEDDSFDWEMGWSGKVQFMVIHQRGNAGDNGIEGSGAPAPESETALPRAEPELYNVTMISRDAGGRAITLKEGSRGKMYNFIVQGFKGDVIDFQAKEIDLNLEWPTFTTIENSVFFGNGTYSDEMGTNAMGQPLDDDRGFSDQMAVENPDRKNKLDMDPQVTKVVNLLNTEAPSYIPRNAAVAGPFAKPAFGDVSATYAGAFAPNATSSWTDGWTAFPTD